MITALIGVAVFAGAILLLRFCLPENGQVKPFLAGVPFLETTVAVCITSALAFGIAFVIAGLYPLLTG
jgi:hypothetical protein